MIHWLMLLAVMTGGLWGTAEGDTLGSLPATAPTTRGVFSGILQSGQMAIGCEHTGWSLVDASGRELYEVDVRRVMEQANAGKGRRVEIEGSLEQRQRVERGQTTVLVAQRIVLEKQ